MVRNSSMSLKVGLRTRSRAATRADSRFAATAVGIRGSSAFISSRICIRFNDTLGYENCMRHDWAIDTCRLLHATCYVQMSPVLKIVNHSVRGYYTVLESCWLLPSQQAHSSDPMTQQICNDYYQHTPGNGTSGWKYTPAEHSCTRRITGKPALLKNE